MKTFKVTEAFLSEVKGTNRMRVSYNVIQANMTFQEAKKLRNVNRRTRTITQEKSQ